MNLLIESLTGNYQPHGDESDASLILAFAFGRSHEQWGLANEALGKVAIQKSKELGIPIFAQSSVADFIDQNGESCEHIDPKKGKQQIYMNTGQVLTRLKENKDIKDEKVLIVAQAYHAPRADTEAQRAGLSTILPPGLPKIWGKDSILIEAHCRNRVLWSLREPIVLLINKLQGKI